MGTGKITLDEFKKSHNQISEEIDLIQKAMPYISEEKSFDDVKSVIKFFENNLPLHFKDEEDKIFNVVLAIGEAKFKKIVRELQKEHIDLLAQFDDVKSLISKHGFKFPDKKTQEEFIGSCKKILDPLIMHARREDDELFPYVIEKGMISG